MTTMRSFAIRRSFVKAAARRLFAVGLALALVWPEGLAVRVFAAEAAATVEGLSVGEDVVVIKLSAPAQYNGFLTANPPRLVVELLDADNQVGAKELAGKGRFLKRVRAAQYQRSPKMISRIVMDLKEMSGYKLARSGNNLVVSLVSESGAVPAPAAKAAAPPPAPQVSTAAATAAAAPPPAPKRKAKPKAVPVPAAKADAAAAAPVAAAAPISAPAARAGGPKIVAKEPEVKGSEGMSPELAAMAEPAPVKAAPAAAEEEEVSAHVSGLAKRVTRSDIMSRLPRDLVTLDFDNTDIRDVFKLLAAKARVNIIFGSDVTAVAPLTLHLSDVPFNEAVQTILAMSGLVTSQVGDSIVRVVTPAQMAKERTTATTVTKIIPLNYTKASDILTALTAVRTAEGRTGAATADSKTNSLVLTESPDGMATEERLIAQLDVRPKQVLIEAKLIEVNLSNSLDYGIQWDYFSVDNGRAFGKNGTTVIGAPVGPTDSTFQNPHTGGALDRNSLTYNGVGNAGSAGASARGTGVSLPAKSVLGALTLGRITNNQMLNMTLTAAATQGKVKVLSDPKVATLNNQPATINVTTQYPYLTSSIASTAGGAVSSQVTYVSVGIQLSVTPTINADGRITLNVNPTVSQPSATAPSAAGGAPGIDQRSAQTTVLIRDGETIVIGGLISDHVETQVGKIPFLGDIPFLGALFRNKHLARTRTELLIFVTPKIMAD